jgi:hypothetical protein
MTHRQRDCPGWLDEDACREWRHLGASGLVTGKDPETIAAYCFTLALWRNMRATLDRLEDQGSCLFDLLRLTDITLLLDHRSAILAAISPRFWLRL